MEQISYLVIWQYDNNKNSRDNTPIDVYYKKNIAYTAEEKYNLIAEQLKKDINEVESDNITIVGIFKL